MATLTSCLPCLFVLQIVLQLAAVIVVLSLHQPHLTGFFLSLELAVESRLRFALLVIVDLLDNSFRNQLLLLQECSATFQRRSDTAPLPCEVTVVRARALRAFFSML